MISLILGGETNNNKLIQLVKDLVNDIFETNDLTTDSNEKYITRKEAISYIIRRLVVDLTDKGIEKKFLFTKDYFIKDIFPHLDSKNETKEDFDYACLKRAYFFGYMIKRLLTCSLGITKVDDRDDLENKTIDTVENILSSVFYTFYKNGILSFVKSFEKMKSEDVRSDKIEETIKINFPWKFITNKINYCFKTGDFNCAKNVSLNKKGIGQTLLNKNIINRISHLTKLNSAIRRETKNLKARQLDGTKLGNVCPVETPEGLQNGLVQNLATFIKITETASQSELYELFSIVKKNKETYGFEDFHFFKERKNEITCDYDNFIDNLENLTINEINESESNVDLFSEMKNNNLSFIGLEKLVDEYLYDEFNSDKSIKNNEEDNDEYNDEDDKEEYKKIINIFEDYKLFINGNWVGFIKKLEMFLSLFRKLKLEKMPYISVSFNKSKEIHVWNSRGRIVRPLYVLKNNEHKLTNDHIKSIMNYLIDKKDDKKVFFLFQKMFKKEFSEKELVSEGKDLEKIIRKKLKNYEKLNWSGLIKKNILEYLDVSEQKNVLLKIFSDDNTNLNKNLSYNNAEIHGTSIFGIAGNLIPLANHNQPARDIYQTNLSKQFIMWDYNTYMNINTLGRCILEPQKQLTSTIYSKELKIDEKNPGCINVIVAIKCVGSNQEDSCVMSKAFIERGAFKEINFKSFKAFEKNPEDEDDTKQDVYLYGKKKMVNKNQVLFGIPSKEMRGRKEQKIYKNLDYDGLITPGKKCKKNSALIGEISIQSSKKMTDQSLFKDNMQNGIVDKVLLVQKKNHKMAKVNTHEVRSVILGQKFSNACGQKGTIGEMVSQEDLPFTCDGITPDIILNPHCIPSRMTFELLKEGLINKAKSVCGLDDTYEMVGTSFETDNSKYYEDLLLKAGYEPNGEECVINGETGEMEKNTICFLIISYYKNVNEVEDKIHVRSRGCINELTRQTTDGRSKDGGLKNGTMERDNLISHGIAYFIKEKYTTCSDGYEISVCLNCGSYGIPHDPKKKKFQCKCGNCCTELMKRIQIPYAYKLLLQELSASSIDIKFIIEKN